MADPIELPGPQRRDGAQRLREQRRAPHVGDREQEDGYVATGVEHPVERAGEGAPPGAGADIVGADAQDDQVGGTTVGDESTEQGDLLARDIVDR
ncbi:MAG TPA: hypothetical protein VK866_06905 [Acidimicrobiales bacterium]|nr:hypothetical protein [Acidimicrobiales bacterium]